MHFLLFVDTLYECENVTSMESAPDSRVAESSYETETNERAAPTKMRGFWKLCNFIYFDVRFEHLIIHTELVDANVYLLATL